MVTVLKTFIISLTLTACGSDGTDIREYTVNDIKFVEMPKKAQKAIRNFYQPIKPLNIDGDTLRIDNDKKN